MREESLVGKTISDRYRIERYITAGGFAYIFQAHDLEKDRQVAFKLLIPEHMDDPHLVDRFMHEGRVLSKLDHLNIIKFFILYFFFRFQFVCFIYMRFFYLFFNFFLNFFYFFSFFFVKYLFFF